jgi:enoyl-CoA hydratase/carnithine racemase
VSDAGVRVERSGAVATLTLDRPGRLNALDANMVSALGRACAKIDADDGVRAVIVTGSGRAFCAGGDIDAWSALSPDAFALRWLRDGHTAFDALARLRQPVVAALNGHALGGGFELAACADLRVAEAHVKIGQPEPSLGVICGWSGAQRAARRFGARLVRRMTLFGEVFPAEEALRLGLIDYVVETHCALAKAREMAEAAAARGPRAVQISKLMINAAEGEDRERALDALAGGWAAHTSDLREGVAAFRAKRKPDFSGD